jgi:hypothetical protein
VAFIAGVSGPIDQPSPKISSVTPCLVSLTPRPSAISDSFDQLSMLMKPGATALPAASSTWRASAGAPAGSTAAIREPLTPRSTRRGGAPLPS